MKRALVILIVGAGVLAGCAASGRMVTTRGTTRTTTTRAAATTTTSRAPRCAQHFADGECAPASLRNADSCPSAGAWHQGTCFESAAVGKCDSTGGFYLGTANSGAGGCVYAYTAAGDGQTLHFDVVGPPGAYLLHKGMAECAVRLDGTPVYRSSYFWSNGSETTDCGTPYP